MENLTKPRLAEVLGVDVGEKFAIKGHAGDKTIFCVNEKGIMCWKGVGVDNVTAIFTAINHPESIIRIPHLTEPELAICKAVGAKWVTRSKISALNAVHMWSQKPEQRINGDFYGDDIWIGCVNAALMRSVHPGDLIPVDAVEIQRGNKCGRTTNEEGNAKSHGAI